MKLVRACYQSSKSLSGTSNKIRKSTTWLKNSITPRVLFVLRAVGHPLRSNGTIFHTTLIQKAVTVDTSPFT